MIARTLIAFAAMFSINAAANVVVNEAEYLGNGEIEVEVSYRGGCIDHDFELEVSYGCTKSIPRQCPAKVVDVTERFDYCTFFKTTEKVVLDVPEDFTSFKTVLTFSNEIRVPVFKEIKVETIIDDVVINPENGGINPNYSSYSITGRVLLGGNPCQAAGVNAILETEFVDNELVATPYLIYDESIESRICTFEYNPVYTTVTAFVNGIFTDIDSIVVNNYQAMDSIYTHSLVEAEKLTREAIIKNVTIEPSNGGFNPDFAGYNIAGEIMIGTNPCMAEGVTAVLDVETIGGEVVVTPMIEMTEDPGLRICTREYNPVMVSVKEYVNFDRSAVARIIIRHYNDFDNEFVKELF